ncbi:unnamed protein product [Ambrosiozyma monospora]|uniref:Unnamed protein product n=1 Tax=Ambrosiozyma monospora TaxID=43982 RepID=A0A9W6WF35_AMBMO|nr:unnamed protein product [Ambrosiozyma monospora]
MKITKKRVHIPIQTKLQIDFPGQQVIEVSLNDLGLKTPDQFEVILKRLYSIPDIKSEQADPATYLKVGDYLDLPDMIKTALLCSKNAPIEELPNFLLFALSHDYGGYSSQCLSNCFDLLVLNYDSIAKNNFAMFQGDPKLRLFVRLGRNDQYYFEWKKCCFILGALDRLQTSIDWNENDGCLSKFKADLLLRRTLCKRINYRQFSEREMKILLKYKDSEGRPFIDSEVIIKYFSLFPKEFGTSFDQDG